MCWSCSRSENRRSFVSSLLLFDVEECVGKQTSMDARFALWTSSFLLVARKSFTLLRRGFSFRFLVTLCQVLVYNVCKAPKLFILVFFCRKMHVSQQDL